MTKNKVYLAVTFAIMTLYNCSSKIGTSKEGIAKTDRCAIYG